MGILLLDNRFQGSVWFVKKYDNEQDKCFCSTFDLKKDQETTQIKHVRIG